MKLLLTLILLGFIQDVQSEIVTRGPTSGIVLREKPVIKCNQVTRQSAFTQDGPPISYLFMHLTLKVYGPRWQAAVYELRHILKLSSPEKPASVKSHERSVNFK